MKKRKGLVREPVDTEPTKDIRTRSSRFNCSSHYAISFWREMYAGDVFFIRRRYMAHEAMVTHYELLTDKVWSELTMKESIWIQSSCIT